MNVFIEPIIKKRKKHDFKAWVCKIRLLRKLKKCSPSYSLMLEMVDFLMLLRNIYMYDNNEKFHLFLCTVDQKIYRNIKGAMVYKENGFSIKFVLTNDSDMDIINIAIDRKGQNKNDVSRISFPDGQYVIKDEYDEERMLFIVSCLVNGIVELINYFYDNKKL